MEGNEHNSAWDRDSGGHKTMRRGEYRLNTRNGLQLADEKGRNSEVAIKPGQTFYFYNLKGKNKFLSKIKYKGKNYNFPGLESIYRNYVTLINPFHNDGSDPISAVAHAVESQSSPTSFQIGHLRSGKAGNRYRQRIEMLNWFHKHGATKADGTPFRIGDIIQGTPNAHGNISFTAYKKGKPFRTGWSSDYFTQVEDAPRQLMDGGDAGGGQPGSSFQIGRIRPGSAGNRYINGVDMLRWFASKGITNEYGEPFQVGDVISGTVNPNGNINFEAFDKNGKPFQTGWSTDYFYKVDYQYQNDSGKAWYGKLLMK